MDIMEILNVVITGMVVVMIALLGLMWITLATGKIMAFASTYKKVSDAQKAASDEKR